MERILKVANDCGDKIGRINGQMTSAEGRLDMAAQWNERNVAEFDLVERKL
jgi:hypothetical protein